VEGKTVGRPLDGVVVNVVHHSDQSHSDDHLIFDMTFTDAVHR
jgi:hypothetical protein